MKAALFPHIQAGSAAQTMRDVCHILLKNNIDIWADEKLRDLLGDYDFVRFLPFDAAVQYADIAIAVGGDGTILHCARHIVGTGAKLLGINTGRVGFLASIEPEHLEEIARLKTGQYRVSPRMLLHATLHDDTGNYLRDFQALNDIVLSRNDSRAAEFTVSRNGAILGEYRADGLIFSTPTGSTAYALSAGGPVIEPEFACVEMTMICPHALSARPILFSPHNTLQVQCKSRGKHDIRLCADGEVSVPFPQNALLKISGSDHIVEILDMSGNTFFDSLSRKLMHPLKEGEV